MICNKKRNNVVPESLFGGVAVKREVFDVGKVQPIDAVGFCPAIYECGMESFVRVVSRIAGIIALPVAIIGLIWVLS